MAARRWRGTVARTTMVTALLISMAAGRVAQASTQRTATIPPYGAVLAGTITWTLHGRVAQARTSGAMTQTHTYQVDATTTYIFVEGATVAQRSTLSLVNDDRTVCAAPCSENRDIRETLKGSYAGPAHDQTGNAVVDEARGGESADGTLSIRPPLSEGIFPATGTYTDSGRPSGNSTFQLRAEYPDRDSWYPGGFPTYQALVTAQDSPRLSGSATQHLADTIVVGVAVILEGQESVTWHLIVVYWNGKRIAPTPRITDTPTAMATATPRPTTSSPLPRSCPLEEGPGAGPSGVPPESYAEAARGTAQAAPSNPKVPEGPSILWKGPDQLTWLDYRKVAPNPRPTLPDDPTSTVLAETRSGLGTVIDHGPYREVCDPKTNISTTKVTYTIGNEHALFYPEGSWVSLEYRSDPSTAEAKGILNHEQRHFDISEVYSRKAHAALLALLGGTFVHTYTCRQWADCTMQVAAFYQQLLDTKDVVRSQWKAAQERYDDAAGRINQTAGQAEWNLIIKGWLDDYSTAP